MYIKYLKLLENDDIKDDLIKVKIKIGDFSNHLNFLGKFYEAINWKKINFIDFKNSINQKI